MREDADGGCTKGTTTEAEAGGVRIYIGGLGGTVTADDLQKTFSAPHLGTVTAVDVIRTKGRSFAYLDFLPSSEKGLPKLFSTYNGCMWKGGRLRLEKAKEHYLLRLRREWEEDAEIARCNNDAVESLDSQDKSKKVANLEKMQLRIFFPRLRKVKSIPFRGTGKHKYSFQRVEAPTLPTHFCDCKEHSGAVNVAKQQEYSNRLNPSKEESVYDHERDNGGVNEEEINMMNSVMNKLLGRENFSKAANTNAGLAFETYNVVNSIDDSHIAEDQEAQASDDDNLIINLAGGSNNNHSSIDNQDLFFKDSQDSKNKNRPAEKMYGSKKKMHKERKEDDTGIASDIPARKKRKILAPNKKKKASPDEGEGNDTVSDIPKEERELDTRLNCFETSAELKESNAEAKISQSSGKSTWSQKSAWKNLVHGSENTVFQISDIVPSVGHGVELQPGSDCLNELHFTDKGKLKNYSLQTEGLKNLENDSLHTEGPKISAEASSINANVLADKATKGASWLQKFSWTRLVGDPNRSSFSISQILPNVTFEKHELQQPMGVDFSSSRNKKRQNLAEQVSEPQGGSHIDVLAAHDNLAINALADREGNLDNVQSSAKTDLQVDRKNNEASTSSFGKKQPPSVPKPGESDIDENFIFMRSAASMKEWMKTKAALSGSLKKKANQK